MNVVIVSIITFVGGLALLIYSSDWLIQGSVKLSKIFKLSPLFVGLVIVAFGTSAPEAAVGIMAALRGQKALALGNVIGSNIANIGLILGVCALVRSLVVYKSLLRRELPIMLTATLMLYVTCLYDRLISRLDGIVFISCFLVFCFISYRGAKSQGVSDELENFSFKKIFVKSDSKPAAILITVLSILGIVLGADLMVKGGVSLAEILNVSSWIIGITVFAIGTSLPELAASLMASIRKVGSISVGNIVGSNIFNILFVLGIVAIIRPIPVEASLLKFEFPVLLIFSIGLVVVMRTNFQITRVEGLFLFLAYVGFITQVIIFSFG